MRRIAIAGVVLLALGACDSGGGGSVEAWCRQIQEFEGIEERLGNPDIPEGSTPQQALDIMKRNFEEAERNLENVRDAAPGEIRDEVDEVADTFAEMNETMQDADTFEELVAASQEFAAAAEDLEDAGNRIEEFTERECGPLDDGETGETGVTGGEGDGGE